MIWIICTLIVCAACLIAWVSYLSHTTNRARFVLEREENARHSQTAHLMVADDRDAENRKHQIALEKAKYETEQSKLAKAVIERCINFKGEITEAVAGQTIDSLLQAARRQLDEEPGPGSPQWYVRDAARNIKETK